MRHADPDPDPVRHPTPTATPSPTPSPTATPTPSPTATPTPPPGGTTANLFVDTNGGSCTRSPSRVGYSDAAACGSIDAANDKCLNGDQALIRGGNYTGGGQSVSGSGGRTAMCRIDVVTGERAMMKGLSIGGVRWLTLRGVESLEMDCSNGGISCSDNSFVPDNKRALYVSASEDVVIENVKYGGFGIGDSRRVTSAAQTSVRVTPSTARTPAPAARNTAPTAPSSTARSPRSAAPATTRGI